MNCDGVGLGKFPARADVDDVVNDVVTVIVDEGERPRLVGDGQRELVIIHQTNLQMMVN